MVKLNYKTSVAESKVIIGDCWEEVNSIINCAQTVIISDSNIARNYSAKFPACQVLTISPGEQSKSLSTIEQIIKELLELEVDRSFLLLGIGGGVVSDITGFVASVYMRGISFGLISTSLLSQVDASTGGKNGVNCKGYKNVIGCFTQPEFVFCDPSMLLTLPEEEFTSGLAEIIKHALIRDARLFEKLEQNISGLNRENTELMKELVEQSVKIKIKIVEQDEKEEGERRLLNFGHTIGHAVESISRLKHGYAIAQGMCFSSLMSMEEGLITEDKYQRILSIFEATGLITRKPEISLSYIEMVKRDKKREQSIIHFVLLKDIGEGVVKEMPVVDLVSWMEKAI